jgi:hypothetical protein
VPIAQQTHRANGAIPALVPQVQHPVTIGFRKQFSKAIRNADAWRKKIE